MGNKIINISYTRLHLVKHNIKNFISRYYRKIYLTIGTLALGIIFSFILYQSWIISNLENGIERRDNKIRSLLIMNDELIELTNKRPDYILNTDNVK